MALYLYNEIFCINWKMNENVLCRMLLWLNWGEGKCNALAYPLEHVLGNSFLAEVPQPLEKAGNVNPLFSHTKEMVTIRAVICLTTQLQACYKIMNGEYTFALSLSVLKMFTNDILGYKVLNWIGLLLWSPITLLTKLQKFILINRGFKNYNKNWF